jgi:hypothetical protein
MGYKRSMSAAFEDLKTGLEEVKNFLAGDTAGFKVTVPAEVNPEQILRVPFGHDKAVTKK